MILMTLKNIFQVYLMQLDLGLNIIKFQLENHQINLHLMNNMLIVNLHNVLLMKHKNIGKNQLMVKQKQKKKIVQLLTQHLIMHPQLRKKIQIKLLKLMKNIRANQLKLIQSFMKFLSFTGNKNAENRKNTPTNAVISQSNFSMTSLPLLTNY